jgi:hypothetical protein
MEHQKLWIRWRRISAVQHNHGAVGAGAVKKGQIVNFLIHGLFCVKLHEKSHFCCFLPGRTGFPGRASPPRFLLAA